MPARKRCRRRSGISDGAPGISPRERPATGTITSRAGRQVCGPLTVKTNKAISDALTSRAVAAASEGRPRYVTEGEAPVPANALSTPAEKGG